MGTVINVRKLRKQMMPEIKDIISTKNLMAFYMHKDLGKLNYMLNEDALKFKDQLKIWRKNTVGGRIHFLKNNCKDIVIKGKTFYSLSYNDYNSEGICCSSMDRLGMAIGEFIDGQIYLFTDKKYRDRIYKYLMKGCPANRGPSLLD